jgi:hypothetical protein
MFAQSEIATSPMAQEPTETTGTKRDTRSTQMMPHSIEIEPTTLGDRGQRYRVTYLGRVLVESTRNPEFDACRALLAQGITGRLLVRRAGRVCADLALDIERGARLTIRETDAAGPRLVRWEPLPGNKVQTTPLSRRVSSRTA